MGNHRDAWVFGAIDPTSGTAVMMEVSRVLASLVKEGQWTIRFEYDLLVMSTKAMNTDSQAATARWFLAFLLSCSIHASCIGWRPRRTIVFCSWGAEEYALTGSYEWVEVQLQLHQNA